jgi:ATP-binding cassette subfamily B protein
MLGQLAAPFTQLFDFIKSWNEALFSFERINDINARQNEDAEMSRSKTDKLAIITSFDKINLNKVNFKYDANTEAVVLKQLNLEIKKGQVIAIVGNSGSGKTTLLKLLLKFYSPSSGEILIDDTPLSEIQSAGWRSMCGAVLQDGYIFSTTIKKNIALDSKKADLNKIKQVCKLANIDKFIESLPLKYESRIGGSGAGLSGGQIQRVLIARALYNDPELFLFDEATSSLDTENEKIIMNNILRYCKGKTMIIIAHRLSTVRNADKIYVLNEGEIVESGTHDELFDLEGNYYKLVNNQLNLT